MRREILDQPIDDRGLRRFGLITGGIFAALFGLIPLVKRGEVRVPVFAIGGAVALLGLVWPGSLRGFRWVWMRVGFVLGWVNTRVLLGAIYFGMFVPIGLTLRLMGRDSMRRRKPHLDTYRVDSTREPRDRMELPF